MTSISESLIYNCDDLSVKNWLSNNLSAACIRMIKCWETNFNKTWHADCRDKAVSKILDWLVK